MVRAGAIDRFKGLGFGGFGIVLLFVSKVDMINIVAVFAFFSH